MAMASLRNMVLSTVIISVTCLLCAGAAELVLRAKSSSMQNYDIEMWRYARELKVRSPDPLLGHEHIPSSEALLQSVRIRTNSWGLRGGEVAPQPHGRRILFLGSSITLGWGVAEEETLVGRLQKAFADKGEDTEVLNAGIGNYNAPRYVRRFQTRLEGLHPTDIVIQYFLRDAEELDAGGGNWLLRNSQLAVTGWVVGNGLLRRGGERSLIDHYRAVYADGAPGYVAMEQNLTALAQYAKDNNIRVFLAMTPDVHDLINYPFGFVHDKIKVLAARLGFTYIDLFPALQGLTPQQIWSLPNDPHPNALGHQRMAEALLPVLEQTRMTSGR